MLTYRQARSRLGYSQQQLADILGVSRSTVAMWESGKSRPDLNMLRRLAAALHTTVSELLGEEQTEMPHGVRIPVFGSVAAGIPIEAVENYDSEDPDDWEEIPAQLARSAQYIALRLKGDSMEPRMRSGDVVIVRLQDTIESDDIAIVRVNGDEATCKKIRITENGLFLISLNPAYEPMFFTREDVARLPVQIIGKVVELRAKF
ncbi:MAG: LexA family protein [Eubacteriales bacterium]